MRRARSAGKGKAKRAARNDAPPDIYQQMLDEASQNTSDPAGSNGKAVKKRRAGNKVIVQQREDLQEKEVRPNGREPLDQPSEPALQTISYNPEESEDEDEEQEEAEYEDDDDDALFEDVDIGREGGLVEDDEEEQDRSLQGPTLNLVLQDEGATENSASRRRKAVKAITDKKLASNTHRMHLLCLLSHLSLRNHWCNNRTVQSILRKAVPKRIREQLVDDGGAVDQYTRDTKLRRGLEQVTGFFRDRFNVIGQGVKRAWWDPSGKEKKTPSFDDLDMLVSLDDFRKRAKTFEASRDVGAQIFCAMLRACGLEVRLVHSLQVLPLNGAIRPEQMHVPGPAQIVRYQENRSGMTAYDSASTPSPNGPYSMAPEEDLSTEVGRAAGVRRKLAKLGGRSSLSHAASSSTPRAAAVEKTQRRTPNPGSQRIRESPCPTYWVEVFTPAYQKWIPIDPVVAKAVRFGVPSPSLTDPLNALVYVIGMEEDGHARDVTLRYTSQFNAKIRKTRVDSIAGSEGSRWLNKVLRVYRRPRGLERSLEDRDAIEDAELMRRAEREGMPRNVEDFKGHPVYALERHLRRNEVIHPRRQVGTTGGESGKVNKGKPVEPVFRRQDVLVVRSGGAWWRRGREIKMGEQPLKRAAPRRQRTDDDVFNEEDDGEDEGEGLYSLSQTELYQAPPVMVGQVPRNAFGNLDVYVPTMIPAGAVHILHEDTRHAAKLLGIDYADAVTGFEFRGRQGTAVIRGAVIAAEYRDAVIEILEGFESEKIDAANELVTRECLRLWRRFLIGLRIQERVSVYARDDEEESARTDDEQSEADDHTSQTESEGEGGFVPDAASAPKTRKRGIAPLLAGPRGNFTVIEGPRIEIEPEKPPRRADALKAGRIGENQSADEGGGGFLVDDDDHSLFDERAQDEQEDDRFEAGDRAAEMVVSNDSHTGDADPAVSEGIVTTEARGDSEGVPGASDSAIAAEPRKSGPEGDSTHEETDRGSLLSEDPEDADADPEWLA